MTTQAEQTKQTDPTKLFEIFNRQISLSREFLQLLSKEKAALIDMDMQTLITLSQRKEEQLTRLSNLDITLQEESKRLWPDSNDEIIKLTSIRPYVSEEEYKKFVDYRDCLTDLHEKIQENNTFNKQFAEDTGKYLSDAIQLISSAVAEHHTYSTNGTAKQSMARASLLRREV